MCDFSDSDGVIPVAEAVRLEFDRFAHSRTRKLVFFPSGVFSDEDLPVRPSMAADTTTSAVHGFGLTTENRAASGNLPDGPAVFCFDS
jgi:hypothetical protein